MKSKKSLLLLVGAATAGLVLSACGTTGGEPSASGSGSAAGDCEATIAYIGPLTGDYANLGLNIVRGAKLALDEYNKANPKCKVTLNENDSQGAPDGGHPASPASWSTTSKVIGVARPDVLGRDQRDR